MGNIFGGSKSTSCKNGEQSNTNLIPNEYDKAIYAERAQKVHKGTIAVAIVYAFIALCLLLGSYLFDSFKFVMFTRFFVFTFVYILGTILIIGYLMYSVLNYKPIKLDRTNKYDNLSCPDYWTLEQIPITLGEEDNYYDAFDSDNVNKNLFNYRCSLNSNIFNKLGNYVASYNNNLPSLYISNTTNQYNTISNTKTTTDYSTINNNRKQILFANLNDNNNINYYKKLSGNIADTSNIIRYEMAKNALLMNNYRILPNNPPDDTYTIFEPILQNGNILNEVNNDRYKINKIDYDINNLNGTTTSTNGNIATNQIGQKKIKLYKNGLIQAESTAGDNTYSDIKTLPLSCDRFYPLILNAKDNELATNNLKLDNNVLRCAYSKMCKVPWSDMNCDKYDDLI